MDADYFLLYAKNTEIYGAPELILKRFITYSSLWQGLQDTLFMEDIKWYQIYWGDTLIMQRMIK